MVFQLIRFLENVRHRDIVTGLRTYWEADAAHGDAGTGGRSGHALIHTNAHVGVHRWDSAAACLAAETAGRGIVEFTTMADSQLYS